MYFAPLMSEEISVSVEESTPSITEVSPSELEGAEAISVTETLSQEASTEATEKVQAPKVEATTTLSTETVEANSEHDQEKLSINYRANLLLEGYDYIDQLDEKDAAALATAFEAIRAKHELMFAKKYLAEDETSEYVTGVAEEATEAKSELQKTLTEAELLSTSLPVADYWLLGNSMIRIPLAMKGRWHHPVYTNDKGEHIIEFSDKDYEDIKRNFENDVLGFESYATFGHLVNDNSVDGDPKKARLKHIHEQDGILYGDYLATAETYSAVEKGEYEYNSPEIIRNFSDKHTGQNLGTVLMRTALTNAPFLPFKDIKVQALSQEAGKADKCLQSKPTIVFKLQGNNSLSDPIMSQEEVTPVATGESGKSLEEFKADIELKLSAMGDLASKNQALESEVSELKAMFAAAQAKLEETQTVTQNFSNSVSQRYEAELLENMTKVGVSPVFLQRFSAISSILKQANVTSKVVKLSTSEKEIERPLIEEVAYLLVDALHSEPSQAIVPTQQLGQSNTANKKLYHHVSTLASLAKSLKVNKAQ